ncbi:macrophomate synthase [Fusarium longipes]|uniref:Macrophomate synthase n=1 Tax=Fusarium longipes TaxID=694270 RepID=A0A395SAR6_9HYPO|nr:macrophomate synthase [Fusarium longipes]
MDRFRALSLFQPSNLNGAIGAGEYEGSHARPRHVFGCMLGIPHTQMARLVAVLGFDYVFVDALHVPTNPETLVSLIQTINFASEGKTVAVVRIPSPDSDLLAYALDAGAAGIVFPQIDTPEQAAEAVYKVRYAYNNGMRSISPIALFDGITNMAPEGWTAETIADRNVSVICQIESTVGVENVDAIARTPGVNVLMVGVADLKATLNIPIRNPGGKVDESEFKEAIAKIIATSEETGIQLMMPAFRLKPEDADWLKSFKMVLTSVDVLAVIKSHRSDLAKMKDVLGVADEASNGVANEKFYGKTNGAFNGASNGHLKGRANGKVDVMNGGAVKAVANGYY